MRRYRDVWRKRFETAAVMFLNSPVAWKGNRDDALLDKLRSEGFDALLTCDKNLRFQQNLTLGQISLIILPAQSYPDIAPLAPAMARAIRAIVEPSIVLMDRRGDFVIQSLK